MDPMAPARVVCARDDKPDPALDMTAAELAAYREANYDPKLLKFKGDAKPVWYTLDPVGATFVSKVLDKAQDVADRYLSAFLASVRRIELPTQAAPLEPDAKQMFENFGHRSAEFEFWERACRKLGHARCYAIGKAAYELSVLPESDRPGF